MNLLILSVLAYYLTIYRVFFGIFDSSIVVANETIYKPAFSLLTLRLPKNRSANAHNIAKNDIL